MPSLPNFKLPRQAGGDVVGLDIQPGLVAAVKARVNGSILVERAVALPLDPDTVRDGEVVDQAALTDALRELFDGGRFGKRVRVGVANQRTVMRTLELPPVTDRKELAAAVRFQAQDQVPMPLNNAVLDFHPLGVIDTPAGQRQLVVVVAAQRDMVEHLLAAIRAAGLTPVGADLSAFALIRSLYHRVEEGSERVLYLNVDGLTNLAIAEGSVCRFTRVIGGGLEAMAGELAERRGIPVTQARALLSAVDLTVPAVEDSNSAPLEEAPAELDAPEVAPSAVVPSAVVPSEAIPQEQDAPEESAAGENPASPVTPEEHEARERSMGYAETISAAQTPAPEPAPAASTPDQDVRLVLENGIRELSGEVRNSLDFQRSQDGAEITHVALSGAALDQPGFADALQASLGLEVRSEAVGILDTSLADRVSTNRLSVAAGLAAIEAPK
jgi:type IV pilus assembly protein PilM